VVTTITEANKEYLRSNGEPFVPVDAANDYGWTLHKRNFNPNPPTLSRLGIKDFDEKQKIVDL
jgi:hypothetical protein